MKKLFAYINKEEVTHMSSNKFSLKTCDLNSFGWFPKFELNKSLVYIVEYKPKGGLRCLLRKCKFFRPKSLLREVKYDTSADPTEWVELFRWRETLAYHINGCWINTKRIDNLEIEYSFFNSTSVMTHCYDTCVESSIEPMKLYNFIKKYDIDQENTLLTYLQKEIHNLIGKLLSETLSDPDINRTIENVPQSEKLQEAGFKIDLVKIHYIDTDTLNLNNKVR